MNTGKQWSVAAIFVGVLSLGAVIARQMDMTLGYLLRGNGLSPLDVALINAVEMSTVPLYGILAIGIALKWSLSQIWGVAWKAALAGALLGFAVGSSWSMNWQRFLAGFIH